MFGAPPQLAHYCKLTESQLLCWGPTRIEKSLLQAYFLSVNYCQYNIVVPRIEFMTQAQSYLILLNIIKDQLVS
ncbi:hypothetical protein C7Q83_07635 [Staphylococcus aureus]|nr:hypothetical protein C7Q83_07635 [Staphylococcus aureus]